MIPESGCSGMTAVNQQPPVLRFGAFELNAHLGELRKHGIKLKLQHQPLQILAILLERSGELVTREEIQKRLWPDNTYVDFDNAINSAIRKLRDALGDTAENPVFIETLSRRGYRFIAPVSSVPNGAAISSLPKDHSRSGAQSPPPSTGTQPTRHKRAAAWAMLILLIGIACWTAVLLVRVGGRAAISQARTTPLTSYPGSEIEPAFSPDGTRVTFAWDGAREDRFNIYVKLVGQGDPLRLTTALASDRSPAWSPDGRWIAFLRELNERESALMLVPAMGGAEIEVTRVPLAWIRTWAVPGRYLTWSADSKSLFVIARKSQEADQPYDILNVFIGSRERRTVAVGGDGTMGTGALSVSPDGRMLAFTRTAGYQPHELYLLPLSGQSPPREIRVVVRNAPADRPCALDWTADGKHILFSTCGGGLWRQPVVGSGSPEFLAGVGANSRDIAVARNGHRIVYSQGGEDENIWRMGIRGERALRPTRFISSTRNEINMAFSPSGEQIAFESDRSGTEEIWVCDSEGSHPVQLTAFGNGYSGSPNWSPDGRTIAFDRADAEGYFGIYLVSAQGGNPARLVNHKSNNVAPTWSRDGDWIYFTSDRTGRREVWKISSRGGPQVQVTRNGGGDAQESPDGSELYYKSGVGETGPLWKMPIDGGKETKVLESVYQRDYAVTPLGIYYIDRGGKAANIRHFSFASRRDIKLASLFARCPGFAVSPDSRSLLFAQVDVMASDLMLVENLR
jgi:Tol biopolymer transport system component/DNA-binding winged helix-turn-helix (wHTH) protein